MSTLALQSILTQVRHTNDVEIGWHTSGGRPCPIGWEDCSQPVFESNCGQYTDHGERGGPGDTSCRSECPHGYQPPEDWDDNPDGIEPGQDAPARMDPDTGAWEESDADGAPPFGGEQRND